MTILDVRLYEQWGAQTLAVEQDISLYERIKPIASTDLWLGGGEVMSGSMEEVIEYKLRQDAVDYLSKKIASMLIGHLRKQDTLNGYKIVKGEDNE